MDRRQFLLASAAVAAPSWNAGSVVHLLPAVSSRRMILKSSFREPLARAPKLALDRNRPVDGIRGDSKGLFWSFDIDGLDPSRGYMLHLLNHAGKPLCDAWPLKMMPSADERPKQLRVAIYTCAGGHEEVRDEKGRPSFLPLAVRRQFLQKMIEQSPDAAIAIGDHVYWDQRSGIGRRGSRGAQQERLAGRFDRSLPIFGTPNEKVLQKAVGPQIAQLYGTLFRSTPMYFVQDDHDYFDNDEASDTLVTLPPDAFMLRAARATRRLYYPEFLPESGRPEGLAGSNELEGNIRYSECFGTMRYGRLAEMLIYDCRRHLALNGPAAGFVPGTAEQWLADRTKSADTRHLVHIPAIPFGWSAGKWGEWYADILDDRGKLTIAKTKPYWQVGWRLQHDRILQMMNANRERSPFLISGDLHSHAVAKILRSGDIDLRANPVTVMIAGPISTGPSGWPSSARNTLAQSAIGLEMDTSVPVVEQNGFTIAEFDESGMKMKMFGWKPPAPVDEIGRLQPFHTVALR